ncbi:diacylglycerol kinase family protein [Salinibacterium sp. G-O1]|uniref:diacylglycerol/lipid kinase family protein n=1 Tax=Salinibacterium sp. G-O1 TaxID=3046208 RepID=UPI0024BAE913|nr:diacylglycerol kinase family protein [Salinibacterium sp. G-O1]MDJ0334035.1 diacylglycerol kinase family protein [Salinibacterium sp. G-O1]
MSSVVSPSSSGTIPVARATAAVIYNPIKVDIDEIKAAIAAEQASHDWNTLWFETSEEDPGGGQAKEALEAGATLVIAAGGDGTVRAVAEVLAGTDTAISLLPSGTGNLLARNLELTLDDIEHSIRTAYSGTDRNIDVAVIDIKRPGGKSETLTFLVMAGVGLDAKIMNNTDPDLKKKVGWLAYSHALFRVLRQKDQLRIQYRSDKPKSRRGGSAQAVIVGNCGSLPANILLLPEAVVDDGMLDIVVLKPESIRGWFQLVFKVFWENGVVKRTKIGRKMTDVDVDAVDIAQLTEFEVRLSRAAEIELDGDPFGEAVAFTARVSPGALKLKAPVDE